MKAGQRKDDPEVQPDALSIYRALIAMGVSHATAAKVIEVLMGVEIELSAKS